MRPDRFGARCGPCPGLSPRPVRPWAEAHPWLAALGGVIVYAVLVGLGTALCAVWID